MQKLTKGITYFIRVLAILLIGVNIVRLFENFEFLFFLQRPVPLALLNSVVLLLYTYIRSLLKRINIEISDLLYLLASISMLLTFVLGLLFAFYQVVPGYDSFAHFINGGLLVLLGIMILSALVKKETLKELSPFFIVLFAFSFASALGMVWELVEYASDGLFGSNMQRFRETTVVDGVAIFGDDFVGRKVLFDTMKDIILNSLGSLIVCFFLYFDLKRPTPYMHQMYIKRIPKKEELVN